MKPTHYVGLALWRGGVILAVGYVGYLALRVVLRFADPQLEFAVAVLLVGVLLVFLSVVGERMADARAERSERE